MVWWNATAVRTIPTLSASVGGGVPRLQAEACLPHVSFVRNGTTSAGWFQGRLDMMTVTPFGQTFAFVARLSASGTGAQEALLAGTDAAGGSYFFIGRTPGSSELTTSWAGASGTAPTTYVSSSAGGVLSGRWEVFFIRYYASCANTAASPCVRFFARGAHLNATLPATATPLPLPRNLTNFSIGRSPGSTASYLTGAIREASTPQAPRSMPPACISLMPA